MDFSGWFEAYLMPFGTPSMPEPQYRPRIGRVLIAVVAMRLMYLLPFFGQNVLAGFKVVTTNWKMIPTCPDRFQT